jgi:hypothetical protein
MKRKITALHQACQGARLVFAGDSPTVTRMFCVCSAEVQRVRWPSSSLPHELRSGSVRSPVPQPEFSCAVRPSPRVKRE